MAAPFTGDFERVGLGYGFHQYVVDDLAALAALPTALWPDGNTVRVETLKCTFVLETTAAAAVDIEVVATVEAGRKWMRQAMALDTANPWEARTAWYVHPTTGNDEADGGASGTALKTINEVTRRLRGTTITRSVFVYVLGTGVALKGRIRVDTLGAFVIDGSGAATTLLTTVVGTFTAYSEVGNEVTLLTLSGVTDMTPYEGKRVRVTSGSRQHQILWIGKANPDSLGLSVARVSYPIKIDPAQTTYQAGSSWQANDEVVVEELGEATGYYELYAERLVGGTVTTRHCSLTSGSITSESSGSWSDYFVGCKLVASFISEVLIYGCNWERNGVGSLVNYSATGSAWCLFRGTSASADFRLYQSATTTTLVQGAVLSAHRTKVNLNGPATGVFDSPSATSGLRVLHGTVVELVGGTLLGKGNSGFGMYLDEGCRIGWSGTSGAVPKLTGALGDLAISNWSSKDPISWSQVPYWDDAAQAGVWGPGVGTGGVAVDNLAALALVGVFGCPDGKRYWVRSTQCHWTLRTTADTVVAMERVASKAAGRVWEREDYPSRSANPWATQAAFYVNATTGSDENTGVDSGHAIASLAELRRRTLGYEPQQAVTVYVLTDMTEDLVLDVVATPTTQVLVDGSAGATSLYSGTIATFTAKNSATPEWNLITDSGVTDWTSYVGARIRVTSGTNVGALCWVLKASPKGVGVDVARVGPIAQPAPSSAELSLAPGDTFVVESLPTIRGVRVQTTDQAWIAASIGSYRVRLANLHIGGASPTKGAYVEFVGAMSDYAYQIAGSQLTVAWTKGVFYGGECLWRKAPSNFLMLVDDDGALSNSAALGRDGASGLFSVGSTSLLRFAVQECALAIWRRPVTLMDIGVFDSLSNSLVVNSGERATVVGLWGDGNASSVLIQAGSKLIYTTKPTVTNTTGVDVIIGGTNKDWDDVPYVESAKMAGVVEA